MPPSPSTLGHLSSQEQELAPELELYLGGTVMGMPTLSHPLVFAFPYFPQQNALLNKTLRYKLSACEKALERGDYDRYVFLHERPWRADALTRIAHQMDDASFWKLVRRTYEDSENIGQCFMQWKRLLLSERPLREEMMTDEEKKRLSSMGPVLKVWRGVKTKEELAGGFSWSLKAKVARWFATRFSAGAQHGILVAGTVATEDVLAKLESRSEDEVLVSFEKVAVLRTTRIVPRS